MQKRKWVKRYKTYKVQGSWNLVKAKELFDQMYKKQRLEYQVFKIGKEHIVPIDQSIVVEGERQVFENSLFQRMYVGTYFGVKKNDKRNGLGIFVRDDAFLIG